ncbi:MAG TPA: hypothetical protein PKY75_05440, partial [Defluviitoga tunisiensis]|nr:hypothetical protein [Defluviitoga tunisiensis]
MIHIACTSFHDSIVTLEILMSYYSNASQLYFDFVYDQYLNEHSESKYLLDLINVIDWSVVPNFIHKRGRLGYSNQSILKALFVQMVMKLLES